MKVFGHMIVKTYKVGKYTIKVDEDGDKWWHYKNKVHREDGPACESKNPGNTMWYLNDNMYYEEEWIIEMRKRKLRKMGI